MEWLRFDSRVCSVARTAELIGEPWTLLVLRDLFNGVHRFDDLAGHLGVARNVLARRLDRLVEGGLVTRAPYRDTGQRTRHEYRLTDAGVDLRTTLVALAGWGDRHLAGVDGPPMLFEHVDCGAPVTAALVCDDGHQVGGSGRIRARPGPGARHTVGQRSSRT